MELKITGRHAKLRSSVRDYAEEKLAPVSRYDGRTRLLEVVLDFEPLATKVEAKVHVGRGAPLVVHARHATPEGAIDLVHDKLEGAMRRNKERVRDRTRGRTPGMAGAAAAAGAGAAPAAAGGEEE